jgi:hypothetical protein
MTATAIRNGLKSLRVIDYVTPAEKQILMIVDNFSTHKYAKSNCGLAAIRDSTCTSPPLASPGSTWSNASSAILPRTAYAAVSFVMSKNLSPPSPITSAITTKKALHLDRQSRRHSRGGQTCPRLPQ